MTKVRYEGGIDEEQKLAVRTWLLTQELNLIEHVTVRPSSVAFIMTWGLHFRASALGGAVAVNESSKCCGATLDSPIKGIHFFCKACLHIEHYPGARRDPLGLPQAAVAQLLSG